MYHHPERSAARLPWLTLCVLFLFLSGFGKQRSPKRCLHCCTHHKNRWELLHCFFIPQSSTRLLKLLGFRSAAVMTVSRCVCACRENGSWREEESLQRAVQAAVRLCRRQHRRSSHRRLQGWPPAQGLRVSYCEPFSMTGCLQRFIHQVVQLSLRVSCPEGKTRQWRNSSLT